MFTTLVSAMLTAAPMPKEPPLAPPMSEEQILDVMKGKGELSWAEGQYRLRMKNVDGLDLVDFEFRFLDGERKTLTLKGRKGRIKMDRENMKLIFIFFIFDEGTVLKGEDEPIFYGQEWEFPAPREGKRR
jgi:hypothetical protein